MKKRKLLETLKELIESNAQLSAQNKELRARIGKESEQPAEAPIAQPQAGDSDYDKLESDNRILSQELIEAKAKILELSQQLENSAYNTPEESVSEAPAEQEAVEEAIVEEAETIEPEIKEIAAAESETEMVNTVDNINETVESEADNSNNIDLFISLSPNIDEEPKKPEIVETVYVVRPASINNDTPVADDANTTETIDVTANNEIIVSNEVSEYIEPPASDATAEITDWQIDIASKYIGKAIIMITEFNNEIAGSTSENKQDLTTLALGKSETFKAEIVDAISACETPESAETTANKRIDELKRYINALRLSL